MVTATFLFSLIIFLWDWLRVKEIIEFFNPRNLSDEWVYFLREHLVIEDLKDYFFNHLSFGQKKRVQLFVCLMSQPDFILLDEPFSGLDPSQREILLSFLHELAKSMGVILSSHEYEFVKDLLDEVLIVKEKNIETK